MNKLIVIEGISGVGKTSIAKALSKEISAIYIKTPIEPLDTIRSEVDSVFSNESKALYYLSSIVELSSRIDEMLKHSSVVIDKYIYSSMVYPKINGIDFEIPSWLNIRKPDFAFLITLNENIRIERLIQRGSDLNINKHIDKEKVQKIMDIYSNLGLIEISNNENIEDTISNILEKIKQS